MDKEKSQAELDAELIEEAMERAGHDAIIGWFDDSFITSLYKCLQQFKVFTDKQRAALVKVNDMLEEKISEAED